MIQIFELNAICEEETEFICDKWLPFPRNMVSFIVGSGGLGKSLLALQLLIRHHLEYPDEKLFLWLSEDPKGVSKQRANLICQNILKINDNEINNIFISDSPSISVDHNSIEKLKEYLADYQVIIIDPLIAFYSGDENSNGEARTFMQHFIKWAKTDNKTIIFIHHSSKNSTKSRGASAFVDAVRTVYEIEKVENDNVNRRLKLSKDNYGIKNKFEIEAFLIQVIPIEPKKSKIDFHLLEVN